MNLEPTVSWTEWLPSGGESVSGSICDFLRATLMFQPKNRLPPFLAMSDIVSRGSLRGGMAGGLKWDSITVDELTYKSFRATLPTDQLADSCDATRLEEWQAWCAEQDSGTPYARHLTMLDRLRAAEIERDNGGEEEAFAYINAMTDYFSFLASQKKPQ